jgi:hypothetical protein
MEEHVVYLAPGFGAFFQARIFVQKNSSITRRTDEQRLGMGLKKIGPE